MKKMIKMSLVAAVAVAGLSSNVSAKSLEEAIQGVEVTGFISYTMEKTGNDKAEAQHDIDIRAQFKSKINDNFTATVRFDEAADDDRDDAAKSLTKTDGSGDKYSSDKDIADSQKSSSLDLQVDRAYFTYMNNGLSSSFGLIGVPLTDGSQGDGINVSKTFGALTLGGGYIYNTSTDAATQDVAYLVAAGSADVVSYSAAFANVMESDAVAASESSSYLHANLSAKLGMVGLALDYSMASFDAANAKDQSQVKLSANAKVGIVTIDAAYAVNDKDGGSTLVDGSDVAASNISVGATELQGAGDASAYYLAVSAPVASGTASLGYAAISADDSTVEEKTIVVNYAMMMSKNFKLYVNYEDYDLSASENELTLGAKYSF